MGEIGVNDKCSCGSGIKYKKCCKNKKDEHLKEFMKSENKKSIVQIKKDFDFALNYRDELVKELSLLKTFPKELKNTIVVIETRLKQLKKTISEFYKIMPK